MLESVIEKRLVDKVKATGGIAYKFTSPGRRSVPDRLVLMDGMAEAQRLVGLPEDTIHRLLGCFVRFVELKAPGKKPTEAQAREHDRLRALGLRVDIIDSKDGVDAFVKGHT